ncbi:uncharacterized protein LOC124148746 isoform X2 [Haliotis rufescens]|uniref:uncharacterized protein LOC124148746 isoform X2 n=1 Tax=Haliotis rufescens TaxID=6454 RepID=UPI00201F0F09|nr:uncharacterized protein LOC124148746 isoform X2 [Haliotis rufescens]
MQDIRRARTMYDMYAEKPGGGAIEPLPEIPTASKPDMPVEDYFGRMGTIHPLAGSQTARYRSSSPGGHKPRPRTRGSLSARSSSFDADMPPMGVHDDTNPFTGPMDPVNQQYYYRQWKMNLPSPKRPIYRSGRLGSPWRHVKSCINNGGSHLVFIDDAPKTVRARDKRTVKTEENFFYPPEDALSPPDLSMYMSPRIAQRSFNRKPDLTSSFNERAKQNFKYWYNEPKRINFSSKYDFGGRSRWLGVSGESLAGRNPRFTIRY